jgi:hypothetical protein
MLVVFRSMINAKLGAKPMVTVPLVIKDMHSRVALVQFPAKENNVIKHQLSHIHL